MRYYEILSEDKKLDEISRISSDDHGEDAIRQGIRYAVNTNRTLLAEIDGVRITWGPAAGGYPGSIDVVFAKDSVALGYALLQKANRGPVEGYFVTEIGFRPSLRGFGIGRKFYRLLLDRGMTLFSGAQQTPDGEKVWKEIMKWPDIQVCLADDNGLIRVDPSKAWNNDDFILVAFKNKK